MFNITSAINSRFYYVFVGLFLAFIFVVIFFSINWFGFIRFFTNKSGSMNPVIDTGSLSIVKKDTDYKIGDIVSYYAKFDGTQEIVTHRITGIGGNVFITKGDANEIADRELVQPRLIIGKVIAVIPCLGYLMRVAKDGIGTWITIILPAILIILAETIRIMGMIKPETKD